MAEESTAYLRRLVIGRSIASREGVPLESISDDELAARGPGADEVSDRVEDTLRRIPPDELGDPREFRAALTTLLQEARRAAEKLDADPTAPLGRGEALALEAVVRTDGTRPTLLVRDGAVDPNHPLAGDWAGTLAATQEAMRVKVGSVGRIEPAHPTAHSFFGTGWVVDAERGLVLTNLHVVEAMWRRLSHTMVRTLTGFRVLDGAFIDFAGESGSTRSNRFEIVEATVSGIDGPGLTRLDAAVLRIEPIERDQDQVPTAIPVRADPDGPRGNFASFCVVGFPGAPAFAGGVHEGVDWTWVNNTLFGNRYGVKRLAAGTVHRPLGSLDGDTRGWVFGHDLTTLGGSSGSPTFDWLAIAPAAFGLHFAGLSVTTNFAHAISACAVELGAIGVPIEN
jgi:hypothetical protein